jgi:hypothetical protein
MTLVGKPGLQIEIKNEGWFGLKILVGVPGTGIELSAEDALDFGFFELTRERVD